MQVCCNHQKEKKKNRCNNQRAKVKNRERDWFLFSNLRQEYCNKLTFQTISSHQRASIYFAIMLSTQVTNH